MESILARALEYTLKYWLKSFTRDQFKLHGRIAQLSNLNINGDALHSSMGLPLALNVTAASVGKLEIMLPYISNVQIEPIVVQIDKLDIVFEENMDDLAASTSYCSDVLSTPSLAKGNGYGFADKIADGMTIEVNTVNILLETRGGGRHDGGSAWASPMASVTIRNLLLYTTNESWQVVNLKEARDFSCDKNYVYVFKKLEWESLSIDFLPHPDMFLDPHLAASQEGTNMREGDGAKRVFFGGERFVEGISGQAYITVQRTELNNPLGLEVQLHIPEAICPALSEPGLRALLRFFTGLYVCLNRGDVDRKALKRSTDAAGHSIVSIVVDHIFLCIKDPEFQLELLMQSLFFSRATASDGDDSKNLTNIRIGGILLRDAFSRPPCIIVQPSMQSAVSNDFMCIPEFARNFCPPIYPLGEIHGILNDGVSLLHLHSLQVKPSPTPPLFTSQTVIYCQPLAIHLQEESCLRMCSFLADGIVVNPGAVFPDFSINSFCFTLKELVLSIPVGTVNSSKYGAFKSSFAGARLHMMNLIFSESPFLKLSLLNLEKDPACFSLWKGQPIDASQKKWTAMASHLSVYLEMCNTLKFQNQNPPDCSSSLWNCVEMKDACIEVAMVTSDGSPLVHVPPPRGVVRVGVSCDQYLSNTSVEQLFFVLDLYAYFGSVSERITRNGSGKCHKNESFPGRLLDKVPNDIAVSLEVRNIQLNFLESCPLDIINGMPLVQSVGDGLFIKVSHRTFGGAVVISSAMRWDNVELGCVDTDGNLKLTHEDETSIENGFSMGGRFPQLRAVLWIDKKRKHVTESDVLALPFININMVQVVPYSERDIECHSLSLSACIAGFRLGGGLSYAEALMHRFGILGPDGGPGVGLSSGLETLSEGPLTKLFKAPPVIENDTGERNWEHPDLLSLGKPVDVEVSVVLKDWLFAIEGAPEMARNSWFHHHEDFGREERCWQTTFRSVEVKAKSNSKPALNGHKISGAIQKYPVELITVGVEGLQILKPYAENQLEDMFDPSRGVDLGAQLVMDKDDTDSKMTTKWIVESLKFSVKQPIETVMSKDELRQVTFLCKSEVESMGRIVGGVLQILQLEGAVGQGGIHQLTNLGSVEFEKLWAPWSGHESSDSTMGLLEEAVLDSQEKCGAIISGLRNVDSSAHHIDKIDDLNQRLEDVKKLLAQLRTQL